jgi:hypothetical protein
VISGLTIAAVSHFISITLCPLVGIFIEKRLCTGYVYIYINSYLSPINEGLLSEERICNQIFGACLDSNI